MIRIDDSEKEGFRLALVQPILAARSMAGSSPVAGRHSGLHRRACSGAQGGCLCDASDNCRGARSGILQNMPRPVLLLPLYGEDHERGDLAH